MIKENQKNKDLIKYVQDFAPNYHLTLQWDLNHRTRTIPVLEKRLDYFMSRVQRELMGRGWHRHHIPFIGFGEINEFGEYHMHILIKDTQHTLSQWKQAFHKISIRTRQTPIPRNPYLQEITPGTEWQVANYCTKQLNSVDDAYANSVLITSEYLFGKKKRGKQWVGRIL